MHKIEHSVSFVDRPYHRAVRIAGEWFVQARSHHWLATDWKTILPMSASLEAAGETIAELDNCETCFGALGGVRGNENVIGGKVICDYCTVKLVPYG
jgi:hypothetical protein